MGNRIKFLDGFRGLAIILVVLYHAYSRSSLPLDKELSEFFVFKRGYLGVQLFFLISGFVILMSLEKSENFVQFIKKRWLRLFPAMLIATVFIFIISQFLPERPAGIPELDSVIPGLIFIDPNWIYKLTGLDITPLEVSFWSLYVEVKFYVIFGLLYFYFGKRKALIGIILCYLAWLGLRIVLFVKIIPVDFYMDILGNVLSFNHFGWFSTGAFAYLYFTSKNILYLFIGLGMGLLSMLSLDLHSAQTVFFMFIVLLVFLATLYFNVLANIFANKVFIFFGFVSYPLYLIHENTMVALIIKLQKHSTIPNILLPVIPILLLIFIAYFIAKTVEPKIYNVVKLFVFSSKEIVKQRN